MKDIEGCVITLPITPMDNPGIGLMTAPFLMDALSKRMGICGVLALNVNGAKLYGDNVEWHIDGYVDNTKKLGILCNFIWRDDQGENIYWINEFFSQLRKKYITKEKAKIIRCECGLVESIAEAENISLSRRLYFVKNSKKYCKLCKTKITKSKESVFLFNFPNIIAMEKVFPVFYRKDLQDMVKKFSSYKFLISRTRSSALAIWTGEEIISLDVDFIWQMFLPIIRRYGYEPLYLIGGSKHLMACCLVMTMNKLIDNRDIFLIIPPYYRAPEGKSLKGDEYLFSRLIDKYDSKTIRLLLSTALNWKQKESVLDFKLIDLISKMSYRINSTEAQTDLKDALIDFDGKKIKEFLARTRRNRDSFYSKELFGLI